MICEVTKSELHLATPLGKIHNPKGYTSLQAVKTTV
jgi:hypothetical protein